MPTRTSRRFRGIPRRTIVQWVVFVPVALNPLNCYAYIDPNAGGWLFQLLFPLLVAIGAAWLALRQKISALWNRLFRRESDSRNDR